MINVKSVTCLEIGDRLYKTRLHALKEAIRDLDSDKIVYESETEVNCRLNGFLQKLEAINEFFKEQAE